MKKLLGQAGSLAGTVLLVGASHVLANEPKGEGAPDYSGITGLYYVLIAIILVYGVYDTFLKKS
jgi:hypothetical protein